MKNQFEYNLPEHYITIKISKDYIRVVDVEDSFPYYDIEREPNMTEEKIYQEFINLASKDWMNPQTLTALQKVIIFEYPNLRVEWDKILVELKNQFHTKKIISFHIRQDQPYIESHPWV